MTKRLTGVTRRLDAFYVGVPSDLSSRPARRARVTAALDRLDAQQESDGRIAADLRWLSRLLAAMTPDKAASEWRFLEAEAGDIVKRWTASLDVLESVVAELEDAVDYKQNDRRDPPIEPAFRAEPPKPLGPAAELPRQRRFLAGSPVAGHQWTRVGKHRLRQRRRFYLIGEPRSLAVAVRGCIPLIDRRERR